MYLFVRNSFSLFEKNVENSARPTIITVFIKRAKNERIWRLSTLENVSAAGWIRCSTEKELDKRPRLFRRPSLRHGLRRGEPRPPRRPRRHPRRRRPRPLPLRLPQVEVNVLLKRTFQSESESGIALYHPRFLELGRLLCSPLLAISVPIDTVCFLLSSSIK